MQTTTGILEIGKRADGRIRQLDQTYISSPTDPVVLAKDIERFGLRPGLLLEV